MFQCRGNRERQGGADGKQNDQPVHPITSRGSDPSRLAPTAAKKASLSCPAG